MLKVTDLLLQGGGFGMVVLDIGDIPPESARRVPLTSWFRFRRAVEPTATVLLLLEQEPCAKTCASLVLRLEQATVCVRNSASTSMHAQRELSQDPVNVVSHAALLCGWDSAPRSRAPGNSANHHNRPESNLNCAQHGESIRRLNLVLRNNMHRYVCLYLHSRFSGGSIVRAEPLLRERAVAVLEGKPPLVRVIALNEKARRLGMEAGMTKLQAAVFADVSVAETSIRKERPSSEARQNRQINFASSQLSSPAVLRQRSLEQEGATHAALLDVSHAFTPRVEDTAPDTLLLDLWGWSGSTASRRRWHAVWRRKLR